MRAIEEDLWPEESIFVPTFEVDESPVLEIPEARPEQFEDAQADDFFEQSLSGLKVEDLVDDEEEFEKVETQAPTPATTQPVNGPMNGVDHGVYREIPIAPTRFPIPIEEPAVTEQAPEPKYQDAVPAAVPGGRLRKVLRGFVSLLLLAAAFGGGGAAGFWYATRNVLSTQIIPEPQTVEQEPVPPIPPSGMVFVPGGDFLMGSNEGDPLSKPSHFVTVSPLYVDRTEVTNEDYLKFLKATGYDQPSSWRDGAFAVGTEKLPVTGVNWYDAVTYAAWAGKRLPTEAEWEFAARGSDGRKYPWGSDWDSSLANVDGKVGAVRPVGDGGASPFGILDMAGNAWEWTASDAKPYPGGKEFRWSRLRLKIIRGGNWKSDSETASTTFRGYYGSGG